MADLSYCCSILIINRYLVCMFATPCCLNAVAMSSSEHESFILYWWWTLWKQKRKWKIYTSRIVCHCSSNRHIKKKWNLQSSYRFWYLPTALPVCFSLSVLWVVTCDRPCPLEILSEVADQRGLLCSVFSDGPFALYTANSVCACECTCVLMPASVYGCVCMQDNEGDIAFPLFLCVAGTDCLHLCKYTLTCSCACNGQ